MNRHEGMASELDHEHSNGNFFLIWLFKNFTEPTRDLHIKHVESRP